MRQTKTRNFKGRSAKLGHTGAPMKVALTIDVVAEGDSAGMKKDEEMQEDAMNGGDTLLTVHQIASGLFRAGVFNKPTMRRFDELCLTRVEQMNADDIKRLREASGVSQAVLAKILNITTSTVGQWERGENKPSGSALKRLSLMRSKGVSVVL